MPNMQYEAADQCYLQSASLHLYAQVVQRTSSVGHHSAGALDVCMALYSLKLVRTLRL